MSFYSDKIFPRILDITEPKELAIHRKDILSNVSGKILEIGLGTGANLEHYPVSVKQISVVEPSLGMNKRAEQRVKKYGMEIDLHRAYGENLPFKDDEFDTVITCLLLCSVSDVEQVVNEIFRVLKPGGNYYFLEHGISHDKKIIKWQNRLNDIHCKVGCGCNLNRNLEKHFRNSEFRNNNISKIPDLKGLDQIYSYIKGNAIKTE